MRYLRTFIEVEYTDHDGRRSIEALAVPCKQASKHHDVRIYGLEAYINRVIDLHPVYSALAKAGAEPRIKAIRQRGKRITQL